MSYLYDCLTRYGDVYPLKLKIDPTKVMKQLQLYHHDWVQYNPRKSIPRRGLSITSLDGGLSGIPDIDSVKEYNQKHNLNLDEGNFKTKTELWPIVQDALKPFENNLGRTHFIQMDEAGHFPPHRDQYSIEVVSFRLFIPLRGCNPPNNYFIINEKIYHWNHGQVYFVNTCKEHTVFTTLGTSTFCVANVMVNEESVKNLLKNMLVS